MSHITVPLVRSLSMDPDDRIGDVVIDTNVANTIAAIMESGVEFRLSATLTRRDTQLSFNRLSFSPVEPSKPKASESTDQPQAVESDVIRRGQELIKKWQDATEKLKQAERLVAESKSELFDSEDKLGAWLAPDDMKVGEEIGVWHGSEIILVRRDASPVGRSYSVTERESTQRRPSL